MNSQPSLFPGCHRHYGLPSYRMKRALSPSSRHLIIRKNFTALPHAECVCPQQVFVTSTHLGIVMEYAAGGELFDRIVKAGRFSEDEARYFFQQLISGVEYCHSQVRRLSSLPMMSALSQKNFPRPFGSSFAACSVVAALLLRAIHVTPCMLCLTS